jgi:hypothetical protein
MGREKRNAIIGQLRDAYDGFTDQGFGSVGLVSYEARFSVLGASTLALEQFESVNQELGERFIKFRVRSNESRAKVLKAIGNVGKEGGMRSEIESSIRQFLDGLTEEGPPSSVPDWCLDSLSDLSDFTAKARSHVQRDRKHNLMYLPKPEIATRLGKELAKLLLSLADIRGNQEPDEADFQTVLRVAEDCLPPNRYAVLNHLRLCHFEGKFALTADIVKATKLPESTAKQTLEDLHVLGLVSKQVVSFHGAVERTRWRLDPEWGDKLYGVWLCSGQIAA